MERPKVSAAKLAATTETLAHWIAGGWTTVAAQVGAWGDAEWLAATWIAYWQGAIPLWVERLRETNLTGRTDLARVFQVAELSHLRTGRLLCDAREMIEGLCALGIDSAPLKGARLAPFYYRPATLRPMADVDLLVRPADIPRACEWAAAHGYVFYSRSAEDVVYLRGERRTEVWHPENVHPVELHFRICEEYGGAGLAWELGDEAWRSVTRQPYLEAEAPLISPVFLLRHLCAHGSSDIYIRRGKLQQLEDIARVGRTLAAGDWQVFIDGTARTHARFVAPALSLTARYYTGAIPDGVLDSLRSQLKPELRAWLDDLQLAAVSESNLESRSGLGIALTQLIAETPGETSQALMSSILPPRWNLMKRYPRLAPSPLFPLCYVLLNADRAWQVIRRLA